MRKRIAWWLAVGLTMGGAMGRAETPSTPAAPGEAGVQQVTIVGGSYFFHPDHIVARVGRPVTLSVRVEPGLVPHSFVLEAPDGQRLAEIKLGETAQQVSFTPKRPGRYLFYCPNRLLFFKSHRQEGMSGVIDVEE